MVEGTVAYHDVAAIKVLIEEAGGTFLTRNGAPLGTGFKEATVSSNRPLAGEIRSILSF